MPLGGKDWHYLVDKNFTSVKIYFDLSESVPDSYWTDMNNDKEQYDNGDTQHRASITGWLQDRLSFFQGRRLSTTAEMSDHGGETDLKSIDHRSKTFTEVILSRNNSKEILTIHEKAGYEFYRNFENKYYKEAIAKCSGQLYESPSGNLEEGPKLTKIA